MMKSLTWQTDNGSGNPSGLTVYCYLNKVPPGHRVIHDLISNCVYLRFVRQRSNLLASLAGSIPQCRVQSGDSSINSTLNSA